MAYLLPLLSVVACPLLMGLMIWFMTRATCTRVVRRPLLGRWCLNWKVIAGLTWGIFAVWLVAPSLVWAALPFVILAACPLSMLLMMRGMGGHQDAPGSQKEQPDAATHEPAEVGQRVG